MFFFFRCAPYERRLDRATAAKRANKVFVVSRIVESRAKDSEGFSVLETSSQLSIQNTLRLDVKVVLGILVPFNVLAAPLG